MKIKAMRNLIYLLSILFAFCILTGCNNEIEIEGISISPNENGYFLYNGEKVLLLGGSNEDNPFQTSSIWPEIDSMASVGGNYIRCTMSSRDSGNVWAFKQEEDGLYNLRVFNPEYWKRFDDFLSYCSERDVIVQIEVWATFDFHNEVWQINPYNPRNNKNYNELRSKLDSEFSDHPAVRMNDFFRSVPSQLCTPVLLGYQQAFVDKLLSVSLKYNNVLYCMDNETSANSDWAKFWAIYIKDKAKYDYDKEVYVTEMWDPWNLEHPLHSESFFNPEVFDFVEISQNNHNSDYKHWFDGIQQFKRLEQRDCLRHVTNIKVYGADGGKHQTTNNAIECYVRNVLMGCASTRFHRPTSGLGWSPISKNVIKSIRMLEAECELLEGRPDTTNYSEFGNEMYVRNLKAGQYVLFIPEKGKVKFSEKISPLDIQVLNVLQAKWVDMDNILKLEDEYINTEEDYLIILIN